MKSDKFYVGAEFTGVVILVKVSGEIWNRHALYRTQCKECGAITDILGGSLQSRVSREVTGCAVCRNRHSRRGTFVQRNCRVCDDCQALRPEDGSPCVCGGVRIAPRRAA